MAATKRPDETDAAARPAAVVIPFPTRRPKVVPDAQARLTRALASLDAALSNQRIAVAEWRDVLKDLKSTTTNLDENLQRYRASLRSLGSSVSALQAKARALEEWADKANPNNGTEATGGPSKAGIKSSQVSVGHTKS